MKFTAMLDVNVVAHETDDDVTVLLELEAPGAPETGEERPANTLQVVLDRSGSMAGEPLSGAIDALVGVVARLNAADRFGVVVFDDAAQVAVPCGPLTDKQAVVRALQSIEPGGCTDLGAGYLRGLQELRRVASSAAASAGGTLLVISDGHINSGIQDADRFADLARRANADGVVTSTIGYGLGYDETLLSALARSGSGNHEFAENPDSAGAAIAAEVDGLLSKVVQAASLTVRFSPDVQMVKLYNDLPAHQVGDGEVVVELGDFYAQEARGGRCAPPGSVLPLSLGSDSHSGHLRSRRTRRLLLCLLGRHRLRWLACCQRDVPDGAPGEVSALRRLHRHDRPWRHRE